MGVVINIYSSARLFDAIVIRLPFFNYSKDFACMENFLTSQRFSIILYHDMLSGLDITLRGSMLYFTSRVYPWIMTNLVIRAGCLD